MLTCSSLIIVFFLISASLFGATNLLMGLCLEYFKCTTKGGLSAGSTPIFVYLFIFLLVLLRRMEYAKYKKAFIFAMEYFRTME